MLKDIQLTGQRSLFESTFNFQLPTSKPSCFAKRLEVERLSWVEFC